MMAVWLVALALVAAGPAARAGSLGPQDDEGLLLNAVVALVDADPVMKLEVDALVGDFLRENPEVSPEAARQAWDKARELLIDRKLLLHEAQRRRIEVPPEMVNDKLAELKKAGIKMDRDWLRDGLRIERMLAMLRTLRAVSPQEVAEYYESHAEEFILRERRHVYLIAVHASELGGDRAAARKRADEIIERLRKGDDFAVLAKKHSHGAYAEKGGDLGWLEAGSLGEALEEAARKLKPGEFSAVIETKDGYSIVKVAGLQPRSRQPLAEVRATIRKRLQDHHDQQTRARLVARLRRTASILRFDLAPPARKRP